MLNGLFLSEPRHRALVFALTVQVMSECVDEGRPVGTLIIKRYDTFRKDIVGEGGRELPLWVTASGSSSSAPGTAALPNLEEHPLNRYPEFVVFNNISQFSYKPIHRPTNSKFVQVCTAAGGSLLRPNQRGTQLTSQDFSQVFPPKSNPSLLSAPPPHLVQVHRGCAAEGSRVLLANETCVRWLHVVNLYKQRVAKAQLFPIEDRWMWPLHQTSQGGV